MATPSPLTWSSGPRRSRSSLSPPRWPRKTSLGTSGPPEIHWDPVRKNFAVIWSSTTERESRNGDGSSSSGKDGDLDHRFYVSRTAGGKTFTDAALFFDPHYCCIDAQMTFDPQGATDPAGGRWILVFKDERNIPLGGKNLRLSFAPASLSKPWTPPTAPIAGPGSPVRPREMAEGPTLVQWNNEWFLYWDAFANGHYCAATSADLAHWTDRTADLKLPPPSPARHGVSRAARGRRLAAPQLQRRLASR